MSPAEFIVDLYDLKSHLLSGLDNRTYFIEPNYTYAVLETLIALFCDKYKIKRDEIEQCMRDRKINKL